MYCPSGCHHICVRERVGPANVSLYIWLIASNILHILPFQNFYFSCRNLFQRTISEGYNVTFKCECLTIAHWYWTRPNLSMWHGLYDQHSILSFNKVSETIYFLLWFKTFSILFLVVHIKLRHNYLKRVVSRKYKKSKISIFIFLFLWFVKISCK